MDKKQDGAEKYMRRRVQQKKMKWLQTRWGHGEYFITITFIQGRTGFEIATGQNGIEGAKHN